MSHPLKDETAAEHIRNALQTINGGTSMFPMITGVIFDREEIEAIKARLQTAIKLLENPNVRTGE